MRIRESKWRAPLAGAIASLGLWLAPAAHADRTTPVPGATPAAEVVRQLPVMTPRVIEWAEQLGARSLQQGVALDAHEQAIARRSGVREPGRVRIVVVDRIPLPEDPMLKVAAGTVGLAQSSAAGMTLGYAVILHRDYAKDLRIVSHELRHVAQYEAMGGIRPFLLAHLPQLAEFGYEDAPFEVDARAHELDRL